MSNMINSLNEYSEEVISTVLPSVPVPSTRYDRKVLITDKDSDTYTRTLYSEELVLEEDDSDSILIVPPELENDPMMIAYKYYDDPTLYWVILVANDLFDMFEVKTGMQLRIPTLDRINGYNGLVVKGDAQ